MADCSVALWADYWAVYSADLMADQKAGPTVAQMVDCSVALWVDRLAVHSAALMAVQKVRPMAG
jgi:hypothetical protein